jgi:TM2 domain-containing membrane protein YozV
VPGYAPVPEQQAVPGYGAGYQQEAYQQPPYQQQPYQQTAYQQPYPPVSLGIGSAKKDKWVAAVLAFLLGWCGIHKFYLGYKNEGIAMLVIGIVGAICTLGLGTFVIGVIAIIEAVRYLILTQEDFEQRYVINRRGWF